MSAEKSRTRIWIEIVVAVLVLSAVFTWSESLLHDKVGPGTRVEAAVSDRFDGQTRPSRALELPIEVEVLGTVRPVREATVAARVMGTVRSVEVDEGARVTEGELLLTLVADELQSRAAASRRQVDAAKVQLEQAGRDLDRMRALEAKEAATRVELERAETAVELARATLAAARQELSGRRTIAGYTTVRAPFSGRVLERLVDPGDLATPGRALMRLEADGGFRLEVGLDERLAASVRLGDAVRVRLNADTRPVEGRVGELEPSTDSASRTMNVKVDLPADLEPVSGAFGRALFRTGTRTGVVAPANAIKRVGGLTTLRVLEGERVVTRHVRLGAFLASGEVEVLSGLAAGDRVVIASTEPPR